MSCNCADVGLDELFDEDFANADATRYLRRGLPPRARRLLSMIEAHTRIPGAVTLEGGSGAGALSVELARRGARRALGVDATPVAVDRATRLAAEVNTPNAEFRVGDFADASVELIDADVVILDRVVCCYPHWNALLENAASASKHVIALSYPPDNILSRIELLGLNTFQKVMGRKFRLHLHAPSAMRRYLLDRGFVMRTRKLFWIWELAVFTRG